MRPKKFTEPRSQLSTMVDEDLHEAIRELSDESGKPVATLVDEALRMLLKSYGRDDKSGWLDRYYLGQEEREEEQRRGQPGATKCEQCSASVLPTDEQCPRCRLPNPNQAERRRASLAPDQAAAVALFADGVPADRKCGNCGTALSKQARKCTLCGTLNPNFRGAK